VSSGIGEGELGPLATRLRSTFTRALPVNIEYAQSMRHRARYFLIKRNSCANLQRDSFHISRDSLRRCWL